MKKTVLVMLLVAVMPTLAGCGANVRTKEAIVGVGYAGLLAGAVSGCKACGYGLLGFMAF